MKWSARYVKVLFVGVLLFGFLVGSTVVGLMLFRRTPAFNVKVHLVPSFDAKEDRQVILEFKTQEDMLRWLNAILARGSISSVGALLQPPASGLTTEGIKESGCGGAGVPATTPLKAVDVKARQE